LCSQVTDRKNEAAAAENLKAIEDKLKNYASTQAENTKKVMQRMSAGSDTGLMSTCWKAWGDFIVDYKKNKETEDAVKEAEAKVAEFMKQKKAGATGVLDRMNAATDSGLVEHIMSTWAAQFVEDKKAKQMEEMMNGQNAKFAAFAARNKGSAQSAGMKATEIRDYGYINHAFLLWTEFAKMEKLMRHYAARVDGKKAQLQGLQSMFRTFATQLETGIKETPRDGKVRTGDKKKTLSKSDQTASLPNIHK